MNSFGRVLDEEPKISYSNIEIKIFNNIAEKNKYNR
jgi:hypothetical protein